MKNYTCQTCGEGVLLEPREVEESGAFCLEHLFSEEFPALNQLADEASAQEKRPGLPPRSTRTAATNNQEEEADMSYSNASEAITAIVAEMLGEDAPQVVATLTTIRADVVRNRLAGRGDWTVGELYHVSQMIGVTPAQFVASVVQVGDGHKTVAAAVRELAQAAQTEEVPA